MSDLPWRDREERLLRRLVTAGRALCRRDELLAHWSAAAPELVGAVDQVPSLREALDALASGGAVTLPKGRSSWDGSFRPAMPTFVLVAGLNPASRDQSWRNLAWRHELGWVASLRTLDVNQLGRLTAINDWLAATQGGGVPVVPRRIRSAEIFGDEKTLDGMATTALFGAARLTWDLLAVVEIEPPLAIRRVGSGAGVLVIENADPFWLAVEALRGTTGPVGVVAWGAGRSGERSLPSLAREPGVAGPVWYWGDVDPIGLAIPASASPRIQVAGLGPLRPTQPLYDAMADHIDRVGPTEGRELWTDRHGPGWLGARLWERFAPLVGVGGRVAQEVLGPDQVVQALGELAAQAQGRPGG